MPRLQLTALRSHAEAWVPDSLAEFIRSIPADSIKGFVWLAADKFVRLVLAASVGFWMVRHLGPLHYGELAYAQSLVAVLIPLAGLGMESVIRRILLMQKEGETTFLTWSYRLRFISALGCCALLLFYAVKGQSDPGESLLIALSLQVFQPVVMIGELWLQSHLKVGRAVLTQWATLLIGSTWRVILIKINGDVLDFAILGTCELLVSGLATELIARRSGQPAKRASNNSIRTAIILLKEALPYMLSAITVSLYMRIDLMMLHRILGANETGKYAAATRLSEIGHFIPVALGTCMLPLLSRHHSASAEESRKIYQRYYDLNAGLAWLLMVFIWALATPLVGLCFGNSFNPAVPILRWHAITLLFVFLGVARSQYMILDNKGWQVLLCTALGLCCNLGIGMLLIPLSGGIGAAQATLISYAVAALGSSWIYSDLRIHGVMQLKAILVPLRFLQHLLNR